MTDTVTVKGKKFNLSDVTAMAIERASDGFVTRTDQAASHGDQETAYRLTVERYIGQRLGITVHDLDMSNLVDSLTAFVARRNKSAGKHALQSKLGYDGADAYVSSRAGRHITMKH